MQNSPQPSIAKIGLKTYLDSTKDLHNGHGYDDFIAAASKPFHLKDLAELMGVGKLTINKWLKIRRAEKKSSKEAENAA